MTERPSASGPVLVVRHTGQVFALTSAPLTIGRQGDNAIILTDPQVSAHHAAITWQAGSYTVRDLGSSNGTYVNEQRITAPQPLRHGDVLRLGNTAFDVRLVPAVPAIPDVPAVGPSSSVASLESTPARRPSLPIIVGLLLGGFIVVCLVTTVVLFLVDQRRGLPTVTIQSPRQDEQVVIGQEIVLEAATTGVRDITRLELSVDGTAVSTATSSDPGGQPSLTVSQPWTFQQAGPHTISAVAHTATGRTSAPASLQVTVVQSAGQLTPGLTPSAAAGTPTGTPATETPTPTLTPTETPTLAPSATPLPPPIIEFFRATPDTILAGACTTLEWGKVTYATQATIDPGIGGVGTPGTRQVCPTETTTYVMTAIGQGGAATATAKVTVQAPLPDLTVDSITFAPSPPLAGQDNEVQIGVRNAGQGVAGPFAWEWQPGPEAPFSGQVTGNMNPGEIVVLSVTWRPTAPSAGLLTVARVDIGNTVVESDESNNQLQVETEVLQPAGTSVTLVSQPELDGTVVGGQGADTSHDIRVGNSDAVSGLLVYRGFLSFDLSAIPIGATIQSAELRFFQVQISGDPYAKLGQLVLKHVDYGPSLDAADFGGPELGSIGLLPVIRPGEWYAVPGDPITPWILEDLAAGRSRFQVRLQFSVEVDGDDTADYVQLEPGDNFFGSGNLPELTITYVP